MKPLLLLCGAVLSAFTLRAAEPWVCTVPGTRLEYSMSVGGQQLGATVKTVASFDGSAVLLREGDERGERGERWVVYPDSTVLRMEVPPELYAMFEQPEVCNGSLSLPAGMQAGDALRDLRFSLSGVVDGKRESASVEYADCRVVRAERLETPAGVFETVRIDMRNITRMEGAEPLEMPTSQWYARGVGLVRQEFVCPQKDALGNEVKAVQELVKIVKP